MGTPSKTRLPGKCCRDFVPDSTSRFFMSLPSIATISLFYAVAYWNEYMNAILYINDSAKWPIQILLRQIVIVSSGMQADTTAVDIVPPAQTVKMAVIAVATLPMLIIYPFLQKYFVKGALVGSVKA